MINCPEEYLEMVHDATLFDDDYMNVFFKDQPQLAQFVLRMILDQPDLVVESVRIQETIPDIGAKAIRMDIKIEDADQKLYDVEFQSELKRNLKERGRYYLGKIDNDVLKKGDDYARLPETYVIFICQGDVNGTGNPIDIYEKRNKEGVLLNDGQHEIFINADYEGDWQLKELMEDFKCPDPEQMRYNELKERATYLKKTEEGVKSMTPAMEKYTAYLEKKVRKETIQTIICNLLEKKIAFGYNFRSHRCTKQRDREDRTGNENPAGITTGFFHAKKTSSPK